MRQAADYLQWMNLKPDLRLLDLACGTGAIIIPAARMVGSSGKVVGVDISGASLAIAKAKAEKEDLNAGLFLHNVATVHKVEGLEEGRFDIIICASAIVLLEDHATVVKIWAKLLKLDGKLLFDSPTWNNAVVGWLLNIGGNKLGIWVIYDRVKLDSNEKVKELLIGAAGLNPSESFVTDSHGKQTALLRPQDPFLKTFSEKRTRMVGYILGSMILLRTMLQGRCFAEK